MIKVLLVDDQPTVRQGLRLRLALEPDIQVVGEAVDGETALQAAQDLEPDIVVMDVEMPKMDGITATAHIRENFPRMQVIMLSMYDTPTLRERAQTAGAAAYVEKRNGVVMLLKEIRNTISQ